MSKLNIIINKKIVQGFRGESILTMAQRLGIEIPTLCHDPRLEPYSSCYLCVVEVEGMRGLQPACSTKISEGMRIETENERVVKSRKFALDLLVSNHYADCVAPCKETCPAGVDVQGYIALINQGKYSEATGLIKQTNPLPAICGRVCVRPCEVACRRNLVEGIGVGIDYLKRYTTDKDFSSETPYKPEVKPSTGKKTAVVGAGPGGLTAAWFLACEGHEVHIYEANPHPGGMLRYGIPPYRLPNEIIDKEVKALTDLGVEVHYNQKLGDNLSYKKLKEEFDAVILAIGSQKGTGIGCPNDDAGNIFSGIDFLRNMEMTGQKYDFTGKKIGVIGGGNTAMDCCRTAMRCGSTDVTVLYRRTEKEMPANPIEIHESKREGVKYNFLTAPGKVNKDEAGNLQSLTCFRMELGEPDASGRRRPVKIPGSEFDMELDYILAAIGQKTEVNFINDINKFSEKELKLNKWGDIDADPKTLQTSIKNVFACGDGVTGPATLIEAIAQGRIAAQSCTKFLNDKEVTPPPFEFISRKDHFQEQTSKDYEAYYEKQTREEMPTLDPAKRQNFEEVELGYTDQQAKEETMRCLECGCSEYYTCDLKKYSTQYQAEQKIFGGDAKQYHVDFSHPYIEIDNNKCILCGRCVRICKEVVGANALGLVNRGFETFVAPSMGEKLSDTHCESCGMCISTCPTGALTENVPFKAGPLALDSFRSVCHYCSVGCELEYHHKAGFVTRVTGSNGPVNTQGNLCKFGRFGYKFLNDSSRITQPLYRENGELKPISFEKAFAIIGEKIMEANPGENGFYPSERLSNEEIYLIQKLARTKGKTNNITSFLSLEKNLPNNIHDHENVPFHQLSDTSHIYLIASEVNNENGVAGFYIYNACFRHNIPLTTIHTSVSNSMSHKVNNQIIIQSYYHFVKAVNYFILMEGLENGVYLQDDQDSFENYKKELFSEDYETIVNKSGVEKEKIESFARKYNLEEKAVIIYADKNLPCETITELRNLAIITGKAGKTASGLMVLKEKNNSQGLSDMGGMADKAPGGTSIAEPIVQDILKETWNIEKLPDQPQNKQKDLLDKGKIRNMFIFGEDPAGASKGEDHKKVMKWFDLASFVMVQDCFVTPTAEKADLIMPASLPFETGGSFTNTQKFIQQFGKTSTSGIEFSNFEQIKEIYKICGLNAPYETPADVLLEVAPMLQKKAFENNHKTLVSTKDETRRMQFDFGCDHLFALAEKV
ncbi:MAG: FAD-dependent oxidoreductase [Bacteroidales bacterium]